jgi:hypothetical protein
MGAEHDDVGIEELVQHGGACDKVGTEFRRCGLTLRGLERDGLVTRTIFPIIPPRVDYELTDLGRGLQQPVKALGQWAMEHQEQIAAARARFDERNNT